MRGYAFRRDAGAGWFPYMCLPRLAFHTAELRSPAKLRELPCAFRRDAGAGLRPHAVGGCYSCMYLVTVCNPSSINNGVLCDVSQRHNVTYHMVSPGGGARVQAFTGNKGSPRGRCSLVILPIHVSVSPHNPVDPIDCHARHTAQLFRSTTCLYTATFVSQCAL